MDVGGDEADKKRLGRPVNPERVGRVTVTFRCKPEVWELALTIATMQGVDRSTLIERLIKELAESMEL